MDEDKISDTFLPVIDKTEFTDDEFPDLMNNKKSEVVAKEGNENE